MVCWLLGRWREALWRIRLAAGEDDNWVSESDSESEYWTRDMVELLWSGVGGFDGYYCDRVSAGW